MEEKTYLGITYQAKIEVNVDELYDKFDGNELVFVSKETYSQGEDNPPFDGMTYKLVILCEADTGMTTKDKDGKEVDADYYSAYIIPTKDKISDSVIESMKDSYGWDWMSVEDARKEFNEIDFAREGYGAFIGDFAKPSEGSFDMDVVNGFATALETINSLRGFYLDRPINGIGMNGWDFLEIAMTDKTFADFVREKIG